MVNQTGEGPPRRAGFLLWALGSGLQMGGYRVVQGTIGSAAVVAVTPWGQFAPEHCQGMEQLSMQVFISELRELRQIRGENARLKRSIADLCLDKRTLHEVLPIKV